MVSAAGVVKYEGSEDSGNVYLEYLLLPRQRGILSGSRQLRQRHLPAGSQRPRRQPDRVSMLCPQAVRTGMTASEVDPDEAQAATKAAAARLQGCVISTFRVS
jgi:hypothetical protein